MRLNILPQEDKFYEDFKRQVNCIEQATIEFMALLKAWDPESPHLQKIIDLEHECDEIVHEIAVRLNKTFVTPIDREDIHDLANTLDDVLDFIHGTVVRMQLFRIGEPTPVCSELGEILSKSAVLIKEGINMLPTFKDISSIRQGIQALEKEGDRIYRKALADLFQRTDDPLFVIKWKEIYDNFETAIDRCEDVGDVLEGIMLKHA
jgi:predicted phosphate transport protein (TIGR00153 family)